VPGQHSGLFNPNGQLVGLDAFLQKEMLPPIQLVFQTYHVMINLGVLYVGIAFLGVLLFFWKRKCSRFPGAVAIRHHGGAD